MFYDIYLYTLCYYICCLLGACMRCTWLCSLKPGVTETSRLITTFTYTQVEMGRNKHGFHYRTSCYLQRQ
jgi:hypothetical protein